MQGLLREQSNRRCRVQLTFAPVVIMLAADSLDRAATQNRGEIPLAALKQVADPGNRWPPLGR